MGKRILHKGTKLTKKGIFNHGCNRFARIGLLHGASRGRRETRISGIKEDEYETLNCWEESPGSLHKGTVNEERNLQARMQPICTDQKRLKSLFFDAGYGKRGINDGVRGAGPMTARNETQRLIRRPLHFDSYISRFNANCSWTPNRRSSVRTHLWRTHRLPDWIASES